MPQQTKIFRVFLSERKKEFIRNFGVFEILVFTNMKYTQRMLPEIVYSKLVKYF
jgi:hypothetical protein